MGRIPESSQNQWAQERAEEPAAKTTAQEASGQKQMTCRSSTTVSRGPKTSRPSPLPFLQHHWMSLLLLPESIFGTPHALLTADLTARGGGCPIGQRRPCVHSPAAWNEACLQL